MLLPVQWKSGAVCYWLAVAWLGVVPAVRASEPAPVAVVEPQRASATQTLQLTGSLVAVRQARLSPRVAGLVASVGVDAGDRVKAGAVLLALDPTLEQHALRQREAATAEALAGLREQERLVAEAERLSRDNHLPKTELALRQSALATARARWQAAQAEEAAQRERVAWHQLPAPFDGVITRKLAEAGEWVSPGTPVLELVATDSLYLDVQAPQERFAGLVPETPVSVRPDTLPDETLPARILTRVPVSDAGSRSFLVRVTVEDAGQRLMPGTSATAVFSLGRPGPPGWLVPQDALLRAPDGSFTVFTVATEQGQPVARRRAVQAGLSAGTAVEILGGLPEGEPVVVRGNESLRDGQPVRVTR